GGGGDDGGALVAGVDGQVRLGPSRLAREVADLAGRHPLRPGETVVVDAPADTDLAAVGLWWTLAGGACLRGSRSAADADVLVTWPDAAGSLLAKLGAARRRPRLVVVYGGPLADDAATGLRQWAAGGTPVTVVHRYATPEAGGSVIETVLADAGAAGHPDGSAAGVPVSRPVLVVDEDGRSLPHTAVGHLAVVGGAETGPPGDPALPPGEAEPVLPTGDLGRITGDGRVRVFAAVATPGGLRAATGVAATRDPRPPELLWAGAYRVRVGILERAIVADGAVAHARVVARATVSGGIRRIAYVVPSTRLSVEALGRRLRTVLPAALLPDVIVAVSALPLTADGLVDLGALLRLPVLDEATSRAWRDRVAQVPGASDVQVRIESVPLPTPPRRHLDEFTPPATESAPTGTTSAESAPAGTTAVPAPPDGPAGTAPDVPPAVLDIPPAVLDGGPRAPFDLADLGMAVRRAAASAAWIVHVGADGTETRRSCAEIAGEAERILSGLRARGVSAGEPVVFQCARTADFVPLLWACLLGGFVAVPLAPVRDAAGPGDALRRLDGARRMLGDPPVAVSTELAGILAEAAATAGIAPLRLFDLDALRGHPGDDRTHASGPDAPALLLFTSGSTGVPKAVPLTHGNVLASAAAGRRNNLGPDTISVNWMPLEHVGGVVMFHLRDVHLCASQVLVETSRVLADPPRWLELASRHRASATWAPNFAYGLVNDAAEALAGRKLDLSRLAFVLNGGEAIVARTARTFLRTLAPFGLPADAMRPAWGMSETSSGVLYSDRFRFDTTSDGDAHVEVGAPLAGCAVRVVGPDGQPVRVGQTGRLQVRGAMVTGGYHAHPELDAEVFTADGWFDTGDLAVIRDGQVAVTGRAKDVVVLNGANHHSHEIEAFVDVLDCVETSFTAACPARGPRDDTDRLAVFVCLAPGVDRVDALRRVRAAVRDGIGVGPDYLVPVSRGDIPKSDIGKIQRSLLTRRFADGVYAGIVREVQIALGGVDTLPDWFHRPVWVPRALADLGGPTPGLPPVHATDPTALTDPTDLAGAGDVLLIADRGGLAGRLAERTAGGRRPSAVVHLLGVDGPAPDGIRSDGVLPDGERLAAAIRDGVESLLHLLHALAPRVAVGGPAAGPPVQLLVVTAGATVGSTDTPAPERAMITGLLASAAREYPDLHIRHVDLEPLRLPGRTRWGSTVGHRSTRPGSWPRSSTAPRTSRRSPTAAGGATSPGSPAA
ncbi:AMP-binding protein, partial [Candidatus Frankia nodulisporulans]|uniref:AMP-binding protein n=1 Tax=Candidatus Frankia nodulisporulans TaxID=2060052 RepID=UPI0013D5A88A